MISLQNGVLGAISLLILLLFISCLVFILKLSLDLRAAKNKRPQAKEKDIEHLNEKKEHSKQPSKEKIMYLIEKPQPKRTVKTNEREFTFVSPKRIYMMEDEKVKK